jgi:hypothetical protein
MLLRSVESLRSLAQPAVLDERLVAVGTDLADGCLEVDVGVEDFDPQVDRAAPITVVFASAAPRRTRRPCRTGSAPSSIDHCEALPHRPPVPVLVPKSVSGSALALEV